MQKILAFWRREQEIFFSLTENSRWLLLCSQLTRFASPFIGLFLNLFLWRETADLKTLIFFNAALFVGLPLGFIVNGLALKKLGIKQLFQFSFLTQIIFPLLIVLLKTSVLSYIYPLALINSFGAAFYWANLNYLTFNLNTDKNRGYFIGLDFSIGSFIGIVAPILAGFIVSFAGGYYLSFLVAAGIFSVGTLVAGKFIASQPSLDFQPQETIIHDQNSSWAKARAMMFFWGIISASTLFTGSILALNFFRQEAGVGLFNGAMGVIGVLAAYSAGRIISVQRRLLGAIIGTTILVLGALAFGLAPTVIGFVAFISSCQIGGFFTWTAMYTLNMREIDRGPLGPEQKYHYVVDNEIFMNIGRLVGLTLFFSLLLRFSDFESFRLIILLTIVFWLVNLLVIRSLAHD
ncbi:MFS transporter [Candidatus Microgenomates bacterium]|nr:MFS transporter [Candidatus Microgenomates bacterium]